MIIFGNYEALLCCPIVDNMVVFNLTSYREGFDAINILPNFQMNYEDRDFDLIYAQYILNNDEVFNEFMKIIMAEYSGYNIYLLVSHEGIYNSFTESIQKFIQQRYGVVINNVYQIDDWNYIKDYDFSIQGLYNLDMDKERFSILNAHLLKEEYSEV